MLSAKINVSLWLHTSSREKLHFMYHSPSKFLSVVNVFKAVAGRKSECLSLPAPGGGRNYQLVSSVCCDQTL